MTAPADTPRTDAALKERQTGEMHQRELRAEIERLRQQQDELAGRAWLAGKDGKPFDTQAIIARVRAEMEKERAQYKHAEYGYHLQEENGAIRVKPVGHSSEKEKGNG